MDRVRRTSFRLAPIGRWLVLCVFASLAACGGSSPTRPSTPPAAQPPPSWTLKGRVVETFSGTPIEGATLALTLVGGVKSITTSASGEWDVSQTTSETNPTHVEVSAAGYVTRRTYLKWAMAARDGIAIDLIKDAPPFSLTFYRQFVRNDFDKPGEYERLRRWIQTPNFYINIRNPERNEEDLPPRERDLIVETIRAAVPQVTGGQFEAGTIEIGSEERAPQLGVINVKLIHDPEAKYCGRAQVASDPGWIELNYGVSGCSTQQCGPLPPRTLAHEVGHAMGFWHIDTAGIMNTSWTSSICGLTKFSDAERYHARVAYTRPVGSVDVDWDPLAGALIRAPDAGPGHVITCFRR